MLGLLVAVGAVGAAVSAWAGLREGRAARLGTVFGGLSLLLVVVLAFLLDASASGGITSGSADGGLFDGRIVPSGYLRLVVALWALDSAIVVGVAWLIGGLALLRGVLPASLAAIVGGAVALGATDLAMGVAAAAATGLAAVVVVLATRRASGIAASVRELRVSLGGGALLLAALATAPIAAAIVLANLSAGDQGSGSGPTPDAGEAGAVIGLASLGIALAVAVRLGAVPFHLRVPRLADTAPPISMPLLLAWIPVPVAIVGLTAADRMIAPLALPLDGDRWLVVLVALVTLAAAALAAYLQDDLRHAVGYLVIADGGLVLLGFAALDPAAWGPTRIWIVAMAASKTALAGWAAVAESRFDTRSIPDLRGWVRHAPILAAAFVLTLIATFGLPGWIAFDARTDLARLAIGDPMSAVLVVASVLTLPAYLRLLVVGAGPTSSRVTRAAPERITRMRRQEQLVVEQEVVPVPVAAAVVSDGSRTVETAAEAATAGDVAAVAATAGDLGTSTAAPGAAWRRRGRPAARSASAAGASAWSGITRIIGRDRAELASAAILALAVLAALTSWGALDLGSAAREPAPIVAGPSAD